MLKLTLFEFIVRTIPEAFLFIFACYILSNNKINMKRYITSSVLVAVSVYLIRLLPINYGVHTILNIITQTIILIRINKIDIIPAIKVSIITLILLFISELINMLLLSYIFKEQLESIMSNEILKPIYGLPSIVILGVMLLCYYYFNKKDKFKYV